MTERTPSLSLAFLGFTLVTAVGCVGDDGSGTASDSDTTSETDGTATDSGGTDSGGTDSGGTDSGGTDSGGTGTGGSTGGMADTTFVVRIENVSGSSACPTPMSPGLWVAHDGSTALFSIDTADAGGGLEPLAEDGDPGTLLSTMENDAGVAFSGAFDTPVDAGGPAPAAPGEAYEFTVTANPDAPNLELASMFVQSNDLFISTSPGGIALFDGNGDPIAETDITDQLRLHDAGTELNQAPGMGPDQAPRQGAADTGGTEGGVFMQTDTTRALPLAGALAAVTVSETGGTFTITITNRSADGGMPTPLAPVFWATHDDTWSLFTPGSPAGTDGLEVLAEDGSPADLVTSHTGATGVGDVGAVGNAPIGPGETFELMVTPTATAKNLTFASMVVQTNDVFIAPWPGGVALLGDDDAPRPAADIEADIARMLTVWDAGTEINEVPGVGPSQAPRQLVPNTGAPDPDNTVRRYAEATNDLAGADLGGFASIVITNGANAGDFDVVLTNTSGGSAFPGVMTPVAWAVHDDATSLFQIGEAASAGLESLAEDGDPSTLDGELTALVGMGVLANGVRAMPDGAASDGPLGAGQAYSFTVTPDTSHPYLSVASMIVPSNDTFAAFGPEGIALLDGNGAPRSDGDIATDVAAAWAAWNAGTEQGQAGAAGADQAPQQTGPNTGASEGSGLVREVDDPVWVYPAVGHVVRVTVRPE